MGKRNSISSLQLCEAKAAQKSELKLINFVKFNKSHILTTHTQTHTYAHEYKRKSFKLPNQPTSCGKAPSRSWRQAAGIKEEEGGDGEGRGEGKVKRKVQKDLAKKAINIHSVSRVYHFLFAQPTSAPKYAMEFAARSSR